MSTNQEISTDRERRETEERGEKEYGDAHLLRLCLVLECYNIQHRSKYRYLQQRHMSIIYIITLS